MFDQSKFQTNKQTAFDMNHFVENVDFEEFLGIVKILDKQKSMIRFLKSYPLFREKLLALTEFDVLRVKDLLDKC